jgi:regulator of replication initiation timing
MKTIENELSTLMINYDKLQREHLTINDQLTKCRIDLEQTEKSDISHKEQLIQSTDEANIYKRKLSLLGNCFKTIVRKASETSERWANVTARLHEQITDLSEDTNKLRTLDERFDNSTKLLNLLRSQHEDLILQFQTIKPALEKVHLYVREYKRKWSQTSEENRHLRMENRRMRTKIDDYHRAEGLTHSKIEEQDLILTKLRKELRLKFSLIFHFLKFIFIFSNEGQTRTEAQTLIERLKRTLDDTVHERDQLIKNITNANKKVTLNSIY